MRSQKQNNRPPRPFKSSQSDRGRNGGGRDMGFIPGGHRPAPKAPVKKPGTEPESTVGTPARQDSPKAPAKKRRAQPPPPAQGGE